MNEQKPVWKTAIIPFGSTAGYNQEPKKMSWQKELGTIQQRDLNVKLNVSPSPSRQERVNKRHFGVGKITREQGVWKEQSVNW